MGNCAGGAAKTVKTATAATPTTGLMTPENAVESEKRFGVAVPIRVFPSDCVAEPSKSSFKLDTEMKDGEEGVQIASPSLFYALMQQKSRNPTNFVMYDLQSRAKFGQQALKFALCPWRGVPTADVEDETTLKELQEAVKEAVDGKALMLYSRYDDVKEDDYFMLYVDRVLKPSGAKPERVVILEGSFLEFCLRYPNCFELSKIALPGPTEILYQPKTGFCLYMSEQRTARSNIEACRDVHEVKYVVNLTPDAFDKADQYTEVKQDFHEDPRVEEIGRGVLYCNAVKALRDLSTHGAPVLVYDVGGERYAPAVCAWYMVEIGFPANVAMEHITTKRGTPKDSDLFDEYTIAALKALEIGVSSDLNEARESAIKAFPKFGEDPYAEDVDHSKKR